MPLSTHYHCIADILECPECRTKHSLPEGDIRRISMNYTLVHVIELLHSHSITSDSDEPVKEREEREDEEKPSQESNVFRCSTHTDREQDLCCFDCHALICQACAESETHRGHVTQNHTKAAVQLVKEVEELKTLATYTGYEIEESLTKANTLKRVESDMLQSCRVELTEYFERCTNRVREKIRKYEEKLSQIEKHHETLSGMLEEVECSQKKQREADISALIQSQEDVGSLLRSSRAIIADHAEYSSREAVTKACTVIKQLRQVINGKPEFTASADPIEYKLSSSHTEPLECELIDQSAIIVTGLDEKAHIGSNTFTVKYSKELVMQAPPKITVTIKLPNGRQCTTEEIKVAPVADASNEWKVTYYLSTGGLASLFSTSRRIIEISVLIGTVPALGSPFRVQYGLTRDLILNPLI